MPEQPAVISWPAGTQARPPGGADHAGPNPGSLSGTWEPVHPALDVQAALTTPFRNWKRCPGGTIRRDRVSSSRIGFNIETGPGGSDSAAGSQFQEDFFAPPLALRTYPHA